MTRAAPPPGPRDAVLVAAARTPTGKGKPGGALSGWHPVDLLAATLRGTLDRVGVDAALLDDVLVGCVTQAGEQAFNVARNAVLAAGFPEAVPAATIDRQCGSSQQALAFAAQAIRAGDQEVVLVAGVESMSRARMGSAAAGADPYGPGVRARYRGGLVPQGISAELIAARWGLTRGDVDAFAARSHRLAVAAAERGEVDDELLPLPIDRGDGPGGGRGGGPGEDRSAAPGDGRGERPGDARLCRDEGVRPGTTVASLAALAPAFEDPLWRERFPELAWVVHAGNASQLADGAAAVLVMARERAAALGLAARARVRASVAAGSDPILNLTAVIPATERALARAGLTVSDVDLFEVNEAFAPVVLAWLADTGADPGRVNVRGGAIANGHPLGASGAKLTTTLLHALEARDATIGLQVMCEGGGMANATVLERA